LTVCDYFLPLKSVSTVTSWPDQLQNPSAV
jgi:hypothetical protein